MDFDAAIRKHAEWKFRLQEAAHQQASLDASVIGRDNACELGKWLHGEARSICGANPAYARCVAAHAAFHVQAGKVATAVNQKQETAAMEMLGAGSPFNAASRAVSIALIELKNASH